MFLTLQRVFYKFVSLLIASFTFLDSETLQTWFKTDLIPGAFNPIRKLQLENESLTRKIEKISLQRNLCFIIIGSLFLGLCIMFWKNMNLRLRLTEYNKLTNEIATGTDGLEIPQPQVTVAQANQLQRNQVTVAPECKICFNTYNNNKHPMHLSGCQ